jgi:hypothetical protein
MFKLKEQIYNTYKKIMINIKKIMKIFIKIIMNMK